jgi:hypothetical protein
LCCPATLSACGNHSGEAEHLSGIGLKLFGFIAELVFAFIPESCSRSFRNAVRHHPRIAFTLPRIPQERRPHESDRRSYALHLTEKGSIDLAGHRKDRARASANSAGSIIGGGAASAFRPAATCCGATGINQGGASVIWQYRSARKVLEAVSARGLYRYLQGTYRQRPASRLHRYRHPTHPQRPDHRQLASGRQPHVPSTDRSCGQ